MFTQEEVSHRLYKQAGFVVDDFASPAGKIIPAEAAFNATRSANELDNNQVQSDGFEREFALGNRMAKAGGGGIIYNLNFLGHLLMALCSSLTSAAFTGVYQINITNGGTGYTSAPAVSFTGGTGGSGTVAVAVVLGGQVIAVIITNPGTGWTGAPNVVFTGGGGTAAAATAVLDATKFKHLGKLASGAPLYYTHEKGVSTLWRRYFNDVLRQLNFSEQVEGICSVATDWMGSGHWKKAAATLDAASTEITGTPGEYANLYLIENDVVTGIINELTTNCEISVKEKRPQGFAGKATELRKGASTVRGTLKAYFENEALADKAEAGTLTKIFSSISSPDGIFTRQMPEVKLGGDAEWSRSDEGVMLSAGYRSIKKASTIAPIEFTLINGTSAY